MTLPTSITEGTNDHPGLHNATNTQVNQNTTDIADLTTALNGKAVDAITVHTSGTETITGNKDFTGTLTHNSNAVLDVTAITTNVMTPYPESGAYLPPAHTNTTTGAGYTSGVMYLLPVDIAKSTTFNAIGTNINSTGTGSGQVIRLGVYAHSTTTRLPTGSPLVDAGTIDCTTLTGDQTLAISKTWGPLRVWLAWVLQGTVSASPTMVQLNTINQFGLTSLGNNSHRVLCQSGVSGALPAIGTLFRNPSPPMIALKVA